MFFLPWIEIEIEIEIKIKIEIEIKINYYIILYRMFTRENKSRKFKTIKRKYYRGGEENMACSICLKNMETTNTCTTACGHKYHLFCFIDWHKRSQTCPICRTVLKTPEEEEEEQKNVVATTPQSIQRDNLVRLMIRSGISQSDANADMTHNERVAMYSNRMTERRRMARGRRRMS